MHLRWSLAVACLVSAVGQAEPANTAKARELFKQARERYEAGAYGESTVLFQQSYELSKAPGLLFNLGQAWRKLGDCGAALKSYRAFVEADPRAPNANEARELSGAMERCQQEKAIQAPVPQPSSSAADSPAELVSLVAPPPPPPSPWLTAAAISLDALGLAAVATGAGFSWSAQLRSNELEQFYAARGVWTAERATAERLGQRDSFVGAVVLISGVAVALVGVVVTIIRLVAEAPASP